MEGRGWIIDSSWLIVELEAIGGHFFANLEKCKFVVVI